VEILNILNALGWCWCCSLNSDSRTMMGLSPNFRYT
jgi:hypothetical protein